MLECGVRSWTVLTFNDHHDGRSTSTSALETNALQNANDFARSVFYIRDNHRSVNI
jgi:hypothetical protein